MGRLDFVREEEESADPAAAAELDDAVLEGMVEEKMRGFCVERKEEIERERGRTRLGEMRKLGRRRRRQRRRLWTN